MMKDIEKEELLAEYVIAIIFVSDCNAAAAGRRSIGRDAFTSCACELIHADKDTISIFGEGG